MITLDGGRENGRLRSLRFFTARPTVMVFDTRGRVSSENVSINYYLSIIIDLRVGITEIHERHIFFFLS